MLVLGIDTSCDDTCCAVYSSDGKLLSNVVSSQFHIHSKYGGVVPELAARKHLENIDRVTMQSLKEAGVQINDIDLITSTFAPGLLPALLVGLTFSKGLALALKRPFKKVHHIEAHIFSPFIGEAPPFPFLSLVVSGGHTLLVLSMDFGRHRILGRTLDDAVGEAFDKVAKMLGFGYPGGPVIDKIFRQYDGEYLYLPKPKVPGLNFSFSGLKSAVRRLYLKGEDKFKLAASFQKTAVDYLVEKLIRAVEVLKVKNIAVSGGVSANSYLREKLAEIAYIKGINLHIPRKGLSTDNGAMIAYVGFERFQREGGDKLDVNALARVPLGEG